MDSLSVVLVVLVVAGIAWWMRRSAAPGPRLTDDLAPAMLTRAGFPATRHNVAVLRERLGEAFLAEARTHGAAPLDQAHRDHTQWDRVATTCERARVAGYDTDLAGWPQRVLDEIAAVDPAAAAAVAHRCPQALLETVGSGRGVLGGSVFAPLPRMTVTLPAPRRADDDRIVPFVPRPRSAV